MFYFFLCSFLFFLFLSVCFFNVLCCLSCFDLDFDFCLSFVFLFLFCCLLFCFIIFSFWFFSLLVLFLYVLYLSFFVCFVLLLVVFPFLQKRVWFLKHSRYLGSNLCKQCFSSMPWNCLEKKEPLWKSVVPQHVQMTTSVLHKKNVCCVGKGRYKHWRKELLSSSWNVEI